MSETATYEEGGWGWPLRAHRAHFFGPSSSTSVCGRWAYTGERIKDNRAKGPDDCAACAKILAKRRRGTA